MSAAAAAVTGGLNLAGSFMGAKAAKDAANIQAQAADRATQLQRYMYDQSREDYAPFRETGLQANETLRAMLPQLLASSPQLDPGYQFGQSEGEKSVLRALMRSGGMDSGATYKALNRFNQDYATTKYNDAFNREQALKGRQFNFLSGLTGGGQAATGQVTQAGQNFAGNAGNNITGAGAARAAGLVGASNAWQSGLNNTGNNLLAMMYMNRAYPAAQQTPQTSLASMTPGNNEYLGGYGY